MSMSTIPGPSPAVDFTSANEGFQSWLASVRALEKSHLVWLSLFAGLLLTLIGVRFFIVPQDAAHTFGLAPQIIGNEMHQVIAVRDLWLGLLAVAFAAMREWRALALWLILGAGVCFVDAAIVANTTAKVWAMAFHVGSGVFCWKVGIACWRFGKKMAA